MTYKLHKWILNHLFKKWYGNITEYLENREKDISN